MSVVHPLGSQNPQHPEMGRIRPVGRDHESRMGETRFGEIVAERNGHAIGIEKRVEEFDESLLGLDRGKDFPEIVGIAGLGLTEKRDPGRDDDPLQESDKEKAYRL